MSDFRSYADALAARARDAGWEVVDEKSIPYGRQFHLARGAVKAVLSCYHGKRGFSFVPGGKAGADLAADLGAAAPRQAGTPAAGGDDPFDLGLPRIGADESGKGDYFGPLVTAAWRLDEDGVAALRELRVMDSKALADARIERVAGVLEEYGHGEVEVLMPREYNPRYEGLCNVNTLLSQMHGACLSRLHGRAGPVPVILVDQFARRTDDMVRAARLPAGCRLVTRTKGEADPAVAAASILARAAFVRGLRELGHEFGMTLPPGAGTPVLKAGRAFVASFGREALRDVAKVHFKTTQQV